MKVLLNNHKTDLQVPLSPPWFPTQEDRNMFPRDYSKIRMDEGNHNLLELAETLIFPVYVTTSCRY